MFGCPRCGFETGFAPLTVTARGGADACPMCDRVLPAVVMIGTLDKRRRRMGRRNPTPLDYLIENMNRRVAQKKTARWGAALTASVLLVVISYLLFSPLF